MLESKQPHHSTRGRPVNLCNLVNLVNLVNLFRLGSLSPLRRFKLNLQRACALLTMCSRHCRAPY
jgi:hypothetical protein